MKLKNFLGKFLNDNLKWILIILALAYFFIETESNSVFFINVTGNSMKPTLLNNQYVPCTKNIDIIEKGAIIVFKRNGETMIKRVTAIPGDTVVYVTSQNRYYQDINPDKIRIPWFKKSLIKIKLKSNQYFVTGDNFTVSYDSRDYGPIDKQTIIGQTLYLYN